MAACSAKYLDQAVANGPKKARFPMEPGFFFASADHTVAQEPADFLDRIGLYPFLHGRMEL